MRHNRLKNIAVIGQGQLSQLFGLEMLFQAVP